MKKILVVDNHPVVLKFMSNLITKNGHEAETAEDGLAALKVLKTYTPDIAFVDLVMPNIGGDKLCQVMRDMPKFDNVFLVILSAIAAEDIIPFSEYGANACIAKGAFNKMSKHVLDVINHPDPWSADHLKGRIIGQEDVYKREVTKELLTSKRHYQTTLNNMSEGIMELTADSEIVYINPAAISIVGIPEEIVLSSNFEALFNKKGQNIIKDLLQRVVAHKEAAKLDEPIPLGPRLVILKIIPILEDGHNPILVVINDITERVQAEKAIRESEKLQGVLEMAGAVCHELNQPLMALLGYTELLSMTDFKDETNFKKLKKISDQIEKIKAISKKLMNITKYETKQYLSGQIIDIEKSAK